MDQEEANEFQKLQDQNSVLQTQVQGGQITQQQQSVMMQQEEKNLIKEQLDLSEELEILKHSLRGEILEVKDGVASWESSRDKDLVILTEAGVNYCFWMIQGYLTKNTLLSNFDEETINQKMEDVSITIADALFMKYDKYFMKPTLEEIKEEIRNRIQKRVDIEMFSNELKGLVVPEEEIRKRMSKEMEERLEKEISDIRVEKTKDKLKLFDSLLRLIQDSIHSTYNRAWKGMERTSLRKHIHVTESVGQSPVPYQKGGGVRWGRK